MTADKQIELYKKWDEEILNITKSKRADYAGEDVLSNFKIVSECSRLLKIDTTTPTGYALFMVILKLARLGNLLESNKVPNHEGLEDSFKDGINYFKLAKCCWVEEKINTPKEGSFNKQNNSLKDIILW